MSLTSGSLCTPGEYLTWERDREEKHEYRDGTIVGMDPANERHVLIVGNLVFALHPQLREQTCRLFFSQMRVKVSATGLYTYPDLAIVCGEREFEDDRRDTLLNPQVIIEVLSPSTEAYDRGKKFGQYRRIESLAEYLLVAQDTPRVERYLRQPDGDWLLHEAARMEDTMSLPTIRCELRLAEVYEGVEFGEGEQKV